MTVKKRMKIGILTFHEGINHGGFFQAFFLQSYVASLGHDVRIINYKNSVHWRNEYKSFLITKSPMRLLNNIRKIINFRKDQSALNLVPKRLTTNPNNIPGITNEYDVVIVGSDIVWDFEYSFTGLDSVYFGDGLRPKSKVISYAPSMGRSKSPIPDNLSKYLKYFSNLSVRDDNSKRYVSSAVKNEVTKVLDPTLLMPVSQLPLKIGLPTEERRDKEYLLVYAFMLPEGWRQKIKSFAAAQGLEILVIGYPQKGLGRNMIHIGPFEWLDYFKKAKYVITSTFHGTIFAILNEKKFLTIPNNAIENKVVSLLMDLDLVSRYCRDGFSVETLTGQVEWADVNANLVSLRSVSHKYLEDALQ